MRVWTAIADDRFERLCCLAQQVSRYAVASVVALGTDTAIYLATAAAGIAPVAAAAFGYLAGMTVHYVLSAAWVFAATASTKSQLRLIIAFLSSGLLGLALTAGTVAIATSVVGLALVPAKVVAVVVSFGVIFVVRRTFVFAAA